MIEDFLEAISGHELGHYLLNAVMTLVIEFSLVIVGGFMLIKWSYDSVQDRFGKRWNLNGVSDVTSLPLLIFLLAAYLFLVTPISNTIIRTQEKEADMYGLNIAR